MMFYLFIYNSVVEKPSHDVLQFNFHFFLQVKRTKKMKTVYFLMPVKVMLAALVIIF